eukprot:Unigene3007_Nuclearia_a/m.9249 Unigene3007_Nuclearia_a/g.9249  ORF Unigene3007_Nuclearia_a/g.9249 Unigene3007_Nuclearia_a/m.9249 type:complete len:125 (+) Unigene3007_Nuclearia_a:1430-1804(+)
MEFLRAHGAALLYQGEVLQVDFCDEVADPDRGGMGFKPPVSHFGRHNDGTSDKSNEPTNILLVQGLDALTGEEELFDALSLYGAVYQTRGARDSSTNTAVGFAFADYETLAVLFCRVAAARAAC